jgi:hypothetical protein
MPSDEKTNVTCRSNFYIIDMVWNLNFFNKYKINFKYLASHIIFLSLHAQKYFFIFSMWCVYIYITYIYMKYFLIFLYEIIIYSIDSRGLFFTFFT